MPDRGARSGPCLAAGLLLGLVLAGPARPVGAQGQGLASCAPLQGTTSYSACVNNSLTRQREALFTSPIQSTRTVVRPPFSSRDGALQLPSEAGTLADQASQGASAAQRDSDVRTNALRDQIQRDLQSGPLAPPPLRPIGPAPLSLSPVAPMRIP